MRIESVAAEVKRRVGCVALEVEGSLGGALWTDWVPIVVAVRLLDSTVITRLKSDGKDERSASSLQFRPLRSSARLNGFKITP
ncbi:hypothetical protein SAMN05518848_108181 [Paenibacillus sp. PDC88]|nr:hypothetical protein SAMN05518848_108181 [Paenibacillus sp. PDC88]